MVAGSLIAGAAQAQPHPAPPPGGAHPPGLQPAHEGFYIGFSLGGGGLKFTHPDGKSSSREESLAITLLRLGVALDERLLLGANLGGWTRKEEDFLPEERTMTLVRINAEAIFYPVVGAADVFVRGGLGIARLSIDIGDTEVFEEDGAALHVGGGVEKRLGTRFAVGASLDWHFARLTEDLEANYWELALQFTWY